MKNPARNPLLEYGIWLPLVILAATLGALIYLLGWKLRAPEYPVAEPNALPTVIEVSPEDRARLRESEELRERARAREIAEREQAARPERPIANADSIQQRLEQLVPGSDGPNFSEVRISPQRITIHGKASSNAQVSALLRAIVLADSAAAPELVSIAANQQGVQFEIMFKPCTLTDIAESETPHE